MFFYLCTFNKKIRQECTHVLWDLFVKKMDLIDGTVGIIISMDKNYIYIRYIHYEVIFIFLLPAHRFGTGTSVWGRQSV